MAAKQNLDVDQGADFDQEILWKDSTGAVVDVTGYTARMQVRAELSDSTVQIELTTSNSRITLAHVVGPPEYNIKLHISAADTAALAINNEKASWHYDLELISGGGVVKRLLEGKFTVHPEVTR